ncbi:hypothetical protein SDC9_158184 [bioreactor metagenome]|uniref:Uncharacterized protein n=1 Tax=bioreactor metagenome TaxID=1076179 RepID=A0A645F9H2_9ZZZZ
MASGAASGAAFDGAGLRRRFAGRAVGRPAGGDGGHFAKYGPDRDGPAGRRRLSNSPKSEGTGQIRSVPAHAKRSEYFAGGASVRGCGRVFSDRRGVRPKAGVGGGGAVGNTSGGGESGEPDRHGRRGH